MRLCNLCNFLAAKEIIAWIVILKFRAANAIIERFKAQWIFLYSCGLVRIVCIELFNFGKLPLSSYDKIRSHLVSNAIHCTILFNFCR